MSCSYGPGRYDPNYEDKGLDYPSAYVRWTQNRNMQAFQELIHSRRIDVNYLTTHTFKLDEAPAAYDMMMAKSEPFIGILIEYDPQITPVKYKTKEHLTGQAQISQRKVEIRAKTKPLTSGLKPSVVNIAFIGAGSYAQSYLLPNVPKKSNVFLKGVMASSGTSSRSVAERFGFEFCTGDEKDILLNEEINTVFIATRHDSHAEFVLKALKAGKNVFVEKPLCLTIEELEEIKLAADPRRQAPEEYAAHSTGQAQTGEKEFSPADNGLGKTSVASREDATTQLLDNLTNRPILMVGYNRRFSPLTQMLKEKFREGPMAMTYRINAGHIPPDSWIQDTETGGARIIGEVCHFVDFLTFINGSLPVSVYAAAMTDPNNLNDVLNVSLSYQNGSIGTISYFANGDKSLPKEHVEIYANGCTAILDDFKSVSIYAYGKKKEKKLLSQNKGQKTEVRQFIDAILNGTGEVIPFKETYSASLVTFRIIESIHCGQCLKI